MLECRPCGEFGPPCGCSPIKARATTESTEIKSFWAIYRFVDLTDLSRVRGDAQNDQVNLMTHAKWRYLQDNLAARARAQPFLMQFHLVAIL